MAEPVRRFPIVAERPERGTIVSLAAGDAIHLTRVLRLEVGAAVRLFDGRGGEFDGEVSEIAGPDMVRVRLLERAAVSAESPLRLTLAQALLKGGKMDDLIRQTTELGVTRILPFFAERSVSRPDPKRLAGKLDRWRRIARESLKQCRRSREPEVAEPASFADMLAAGAESEVRLFYWENAAGAARPSDGWGRPGRVNRPASVFAVLGPEGGFSEAEAEAAREAGFTPAGLGPRILRAETAAVAACALLQGRFGDMGWAAAGRGNFFDPFSQTA
ncbi:MAG: 16S rRNA (uracil(1498)-N(3))-methyltransferase [Desulfococcaceae bacterium]